MPRTAARCSCHRRCSQRIRERLPPPISIRDLGSVRLKDLATPEHVYQVVHPELRAEFPALRSLEATPNNLPQQMSSFVGREHDLDDVRRVLREARLVTIVGSGGIGKTRLSLQVAAEVLDAYPDGVWLVELGPVSDPGLVPSAVAQVLGVEARASGKALVESLCNHLKTRRLLLVLDNCEHLIDACADLAMAVLARTPDVRLLATSREPLRVQGEQVVWLPPLQLPDRESGGESAIGAAAVQLFVERVRLQQPGFTLDVRHIAAIALLCTHLDGIPLALELAAALVPFQSIEEISARLGDRFRLLTRGSRTALPHQQTLRATLDWSYGLLNDDERRALNRLSIFPGGFSLEAASKIVGDGKIDEFAAVDLLSQLVTRSLVVADSTAGVTRYRLLETTRAYALGKLADAGETAAVARRHAEYFRQFFGDAPDEWLRMSDDSWRARYLSERDNLRAAIDFALGADGDATLAVALSGMSGPRMVGAVIAGRGPESARGCRRADRPGRAGTGSGAGVALAGSDVGHGVARQGGRGARTCRRVVPTPERRSPSWLGGRATCARACGDGSGRGSGDDSRPVVRRARGRGHAEGARRLLRFFRGREIDEG